MSTPDPRPPQQPAPVALESVGLTPPSPPGAAESGARAEAPAAAPAVGTPPLVAPSSAAGEVQRMGATLRAFGIGMALLACLSTAAVVVAWNAHQRAKAAEQEMARRERDSSSRSVEAATLARESSDLARDAAAKLGLLEAKVAEAAGQRGQLDGLIQTLSRAHDETLLADIEAALRAAQQQAALTGSAEPLAVALRTADERLGSSPQPRLLAIRRAVQSDLQALRATPSADVASLARRLDDVLRGVDDWPLLAAHDARVRGPLRHRALPPAAGPAAPSASGASAAARAVTTPRGLRLPQPQEGSLMDRWSDAIAHAGQAIGEEARSLVRVTRTESPDPALIAPDQAYFVREHLKLRVLQARLALWSRQYDAAQADLREADALLLRWFDPSSQRVQAAHEQLALLAQQMRLVSWPQPEATLAALAAAAGSR